MKIICFHQSADMYGSDRSFLQVVEFLKSCGRFTKITIVLPRNGPLVNKLQDLGVEVLFMKLSLLSKTYLKTFKWGKIIFPMLNFREKKRLIEDYDIFYVNTSVILDFYLLAPFIKIKKIIHIREIPPKWLANILSPLIRKSKSTVIFNSKSTSDSFSKFEDSIMIHNAFEGFSDLEDSILRSSSEPLRILLIGRINTWKGQDFAISALSKISEENFILKIVGSVFSGNEHILEDLKSLVKSLDLEKKITFQDFEENPKDIYAWSDIVIAPSKKPEPFGRIAIEAMSLGKPVIAASHGGLPEIVTNDSGVLFTPNDEKSFIEGVLKYIKDRNILALHSKNARTVFEEKFSVAQFHKELDKIFR